MPPLGEEIAEHPTTAVRWKDEVTHIKDEATVSRVANGASLTGTDWTHTENRAMDIMHGKAPDQMDWNGAC